MSEPEKEQVAGKSTRRRRLFRGAGLVLGLLLALIVTLALTARKPRSFYWSGRKVSLSLQTRKPGQPYPGQGWFVRSSWDGPTGELTHGEMYGIKLVNYLVRLDIVYDPIAEIKRRLPKTVPGLLKAVASREPMVKQCAGEALVKMGPAASAAFATLLRDYQQGDDEVDGVILELAKAAGASAVEPLSQALKDSDPRIRQKAAEALGEIGAEATPCISELTVALHDSAPAVVLASALSLRKIDRHDHGEVPILVKMLGNQDPQVSTGAIAVLGKFGEDAREAVDPLIKVLENGSSQNAGWTARTLGLIGPAALPAVPPLIRLLYSSDSQTLNFAMEALGRLGEDAQAAIPRLLELTQQQEQMWGAFSALSCMGTNATPGLVELYCHGKPTQSGMAVRAFLKLGPKAAAAVPALIESLRSGSAGRAAAAAHALGQVGEKARAAIPPLAELLHDDSARVRIRAAEALWKLDRQTNAVLPVMVGELREWSRDPDALRRQTTDMEGQSRQQVAAEVLGEIGPAAGESIPFLRQMQRSSFAEQNTAATEALEKILQ